MASWRKDIDSLSFTPETHKGCCVVHRRAFGTLLGFTPRPEDCERWFDAHRADFEQAAAAKIRRAGLPESAPFHLNSRDIARALTAVKRPALGMSVERASGRRFCS